ncbi:hypothetical protein BJ875DRAFT_467699 [Amylocarpus encephaloides]|uniref:Dihydroorotate dehydrogenase catalytic domain-containing protein n=1 Tax=Amylocarpus encephaloides TaxID=45428 RepID=A0A9P7YEQ8_9HELO|nr:hypothetical protein BJ875DRAFT_467699 [Amylocarpus encephaloides]
MSSPTAPLDVTPFKISPPLLNSSCPWATTPQHLLRAYLSPHTGAVTTRTSLLKGFDQDLEIHQHTFFSSQSGHSALKALSPETVVSAKDLEGGEIGTSSLNTYGYSPIVFSEYLRYLRGMRDAGYLNGNLKPFIVSVTGSPEEVAECCTRLLKFQNEQGSVESRKGGGGLIVMMEINLSCPNIPDKPPPAYDATSLVEYISAVAKAQLSFAQISSNQERMGLNVGIKTPPYTYSAQFKVLLSALESSAELYGTCPIHFITATNTLGSCLVMDVSGEPALGSANGMGIGGMAGDGLHAISLGNVKTIWTLLDGSEKNSVRNIKIIGVGGVKGKDGFGRMRSVGADAVAVATVYGRIGVGAFCYISGAVVVVGEGMVCKECENLEFRAKNLAYSL